MTTTIGYLMKPNFPTQMNENVKSPKPAKCVMSMNNKLQKVETNTIFQPQSYNFKQSQSIPVDETIRFVSSTGSSLSELGKKLMGACDTGDYEAVEHLLSQGAPFLSDWLGTTALHIAVQRNHPKIVQKLLIGGISNNCRNKVDRSALHMAADAGFLDVVKVLVNRGANVNCLDMLQMTPLHWAVQGGHYDVVKYLLDIKTTIIDFKNKFNLTALDIAYQLNRKDIIELIENLTDRINSKKEITASIVTDGLDFLAFDPEMFETSNEKEPRDPLCVISSSTDMENYHIQPLSGKIMPLSTNEKMFSAMEPHENLTSQQRQPVKFKIDVNENSNNKVNTITNTAFTKPFGMKINPILDLENFNFQPISESNIKILRSEIIVPPSTNFNQQQPNVKHSVKSTSIQKQPSTDIKQPQIIANQPKECVKTNIEVSNKIKTLITPSPHQRKVNILRKSNKIPVKNAKYDDFNDPDEDPVKLLESAGINLINNDDLGEAHILDRAIENGHSVVLTDAGKQILKSIEQSEDNTHREAKKKTITLTPEQFVQMMNGQKRPFSNNIKVLSANPPNKKMVMTKNKLVAKKSNSVLEAKSSETTHHQPKSASKTYTQQHMDEVINQLEDAKRTIEEYKIKLMQKEQETERYKKQMKLLMDLS